MRRKWLLYLNKLIDGNFTARIKIEAEQYFWLLILRRVVLFREELLIGVLWRYF